jgi:DNA ligase (NAD+)
MSQIQRRCSYKKSTSKTTKWPKEIKRRTKKNINVSSESTPMDTAKQNIIDFKQNGIRTLESLSEKELSDMIVFANAEYYNTMPIITDNEYDIVKEYIDRKYPQNTVIEQVGAPVKKNKVTLPYEMPSMDKIKPDSSALVNWMKKYSGPFALSCKLDGVSGMYSTEGKTPKLYTRGDGKIGQDISHLIPFLKLPKEKGIVVRGEFIIPKETFDEKYKVLFANPRNLVSGIVNSKSADKKMEDLHFVAYELIRPQMIPSEQMKHLTNIKFEVVQHITTETLTNDMLSQVLVDWRKNYAYEIDGIIVTDDKVYSRISGNPEHSFAFKMVLSEQMAEVKVVDVVWTASKNGYLKPVVVVEPVRLGGVTIQKASGMNGRFIEENKIGIGAIIQIIRSGDVIPYIMSVTVPAEKTKMPDVPYTWTKTHIDIILENANVDSTVIEKNITAFFTDLEVDGLSTGNVKRIIEAGYNTVPKILKMEKSDFEKVEGFGATMVEKIYGGIRDKVKNATLLQIMGASNLFGRGMGLRKMEPIMTACPDILTSKDTPEQKKAKLMEIKGIGPQNTTSFVDNIPQFLAFLKECDLEGKLQRPSGPADAPVSEQVIRNVTHPLYGKKIVMTKVRDKNIIDKLNLLGATLEDAVNKNIFTVIVKSLDDESNKTKKAKELGIPIVTPDEFTAKYLS